MSKITVSEIQEIYNKVTELRVRLDPDEDPDMEGVLDEIRDSLKYLEELASYPMEQMERGAEAPEGSEHPQK